MTNVIAATGTGRCVIGLTKSGRAIMPGPLLFSGKCGAMIDYTITIGNIIEIGSIIGGGQVREEDAHLARRLPAMML
jgi:hypothetical protein